MSARSAPPVLAPPRRPDGSMSALHPGPKRTSATRGAPPAVHDVLRSPGRPLDADVRADMEARLGHDFSRVRVHADERAAESARLVAAHAYAVGNHVVFGAGRYAPRTSTGQRALVHELAHVKQQGHDERSVTPTLQIGQADTAAEREAARAAVSPARLAGTLWAASAPAGLIQRQELTREQLLERLEQVEAEIEAGATYEETEVLWDERDAILEALARVGPTEAKEPERLPAHPDAWHGIELFPLVKDELPGGMSSLLNGHVYADVYRFVPYARLSEGELVWYYTAYNTEMERIEFAIGPHELDEFIGRIGWFRFVGAGFFPVTAGAEPPAYAIESAQMIRKAGKGDIGGAVSAFGESWSLAFRDPTFWMQAVPATLAPFAGAKPTGPPRPKGAPPAASKPPAQAPKPAPAGASAKPPAAAKPVAGAGGSAKPPRTVKPPPNSGGAAPPSTVKLPANAGAGGKPPSTVKLPANPAGGANPPSTVKLQPKAGGGGKPPSGRPPSGSGGGGKPPSGSKPPLSSGSTSKLSSSKAKTKTVPGTGSGGASGGPRPPTRTHDPAEYDVSPVSEGANASKYRVKHKTTGEEFIFKPARGEVDILGGELGIRPGQRYRRAPAAAAVAKELDIPMPKTEVAEFSGPLLGEDLTGVPGSLQTWVTEGKTLWEIKIGDPAQYKSIMKSQMKYDLDAFDYLIANADRHTGNLIVVTEPGTGALKKLIPIDTDAAFPPTPQRFTKGPGMPYPGHQQPLPPSISQNLYDRLKGLKTKQAAWEYSLSAYLEPAEIAGMFARLEEILTKVASGQIAVVP